jgi:hypothetical protein
LSKAKKGKTMKLVEVYRAMGEAEALIIKSLLESNGILCLIKSHAAPSVHVFTADGMGEFRVMVGEAKAEEAKGLIGERGSV